MKLRDVQEIACTYMNRGVQTSVVKKIKMAGIMYIECANVDTPKD